MDNNCDTLIQWGGELKDRLEKTIIQLKNIRYLIRENGPAEETTRQLRQKKTDIIRIEKMYNSVRKDIEKCLPAFSFGKKSRFR